MFLLVRVCVPLSVFIFYFRFKYENFVNFIEISVVQFCKMSFRIYVQRL